jgi:hypothetical protein
MAHTRLPSWISPVPRDWGTATRGKPSAEQWRVIFTIHLTITLIRLWCNDTDRKQDLLSNFMDLVSAVSLANMLFSSKDQIQAYRNHIFRYISGLKNLFPHQHLKPIHHAALHIGDILQLFGPVHSHSAPFYERHIKFLHSININLKPGPSPMKSICLSN